MFRKIPLVTLTFTKDIFIICKTKFVPYINGVLFETGYAITTGRFISKNTFSIAVGAPRAANIGKVSNECMIVVLRQSK